MKLLSITGELIFESDTVDTVCDTAKAAIKAGKSLRGAYLSSVNLSGTYLSGAYLSGAYLSGADLSGADLRGTDLRGTDLRGADLRIANLSGTDLRGADLSGADLSGAETFEKYLSEVVPALLEAGGKTVAEVVASGAWDCHAWTNCPMAVAFGVQKLSDVPALYRPRAEEFVSFFDAGLIPKPAVA